MKGWMVVRHNEKGNIAQNGAEQLFGVDFHDFTQKEQALTNYELAEEFGVNLGSVKKLKKKLGRG
jgi:hypothetical protein